MNSATVFTRVILVISILILIMGVIFVGIGIKESAEFNRTEKIKMTFTEPVVSVSEGKDADDNKEFTMYVKYVYNGEERTYSFTKRDRTDVGKMVTFTKYFLPDGTEIKNEGKGFIPFGITSIGLSLPGIALFVFNAVTTRKEQKRIAQTQT